MEEQEEGAERVRGSKLRWREGRVGKGGEDTVKRVSGIAQSSSFYQLCFVFVCSLVAIYVIFA